MRGAYADAGGWEGPPSKGQLAGEAAHQRGCVSSPQTLPGLRGRGTQSTSNERPHDAICRELHEDGWLFRLRHPRPESPAGLTRTA